MKKIKKFWSKFRLNWLTLVTTHHEYFLPKNCSSSAASKTCSILSVLARTKTLTRFRLTRLRSWSLIFLTSILMIKCLMLEFLKRSLYWYSISVRNKALVSAFFFWVSCSDSVQKLTEGIVVEDGSVGHVQLLGDVADQLRYDVVGGHDVDQVLGIHHLGALAPISVNYVVHNK